MGTRAARGRLKRCVSRFTRNDASNFDEKEHADERWERLISPRNARVGSAIGHADGEKTSVHPRLASTGGLLRVSWRTTITSVGRPSDANDPEVVRTMMLSRRPGRQSTFENRTVVDRCSRAISSEKVLQSKDRKSRHLTRGQKRIGSQ